MHEEDFPECALISSLSLKSEAWKERDFGAALKNPQALLLKASYEGKATGYLVSYFALDEAELNSIAVSVDFRRKGIGKALMAVFYKMLKEQNIKSIYLEVREGNSSAISFYKGEGFESFSKRLRFYDDPIEDAVLMRKSI